jgi:hypothetical protein
VTYPSVIKGFGNAFLETLYFKHPILVHIYDVFRSDIKPKGIQVISYTDFITEESVNQARHYLSNPEHWMEIADKNHKIAQQHYSNNLIEKSLKSLLDEIRVE